MSTSFQADTDGSEKKDNLIVHEGEPEQTDERASVGASVRDMAARIPEQLSELFGTWGPDHECADRRHLPRLRDGSERAESHGGTDKREELAAAYRA